MHQHKIIINNHFFQRAVFRWIYFKFNTIRPWFNQNACHCSLSPSTIFSYLFSFLDPNMAIAWKIICQEIDKKIHTSTMYCWKFEWRVANVELIRWHKLQCACSKSDHHTEFHYDLFVIPWRVFEKFKCNN